MNEQNTTAEDERRVEEALRRFDAGYSAGFAAGMAHAVAVLESEEQRARAASRNQDMKGKQ